MGHGWHNIWTNFSIKIVRTVDWSTLSMNYFTGQCLSSIFDVSENAEWHGCWLNFLLQTDTDGLPTLKSIAQEATNRAGLKVPLSQASTQQAQMSVPGSTAPSISQSGKSLVTAFFSSLYPLDLKRPFINYADMILRIFDLPSMKSYCISLCSSVDIWLPCSPSLSAYFMNCP